jgi:transcriptional regulator with XRE-family HTH domain
MKVHNYQYIKDELEAQNKTISWLAKEVGVSKGYISKLLNNKVREPGMNKIESINKVLGIEMDIENYTKLAYLVDVNMMSVEKYVYITTRCVASNSDIYICVDTKNINSEINLRRFYDYLSFSKSKVVLVNKAQLKKIITNSSYDKIYAFNDEFDFINKVDITKIVMEKENAIELKNIRNKALLVLANNSSYLSILLNVLKLKTDYYIDDYSTYKPVNKHSNLFISNKLNVVEQIYQRCRSCKKYIVGNEYISFYDNENINDYKEAMIKIDSYLDLFDYIYIIDFDVDNDGSKIDVLNNKISKMNKNSKIIKIKESDINSISDSIINKMG